MSDTNMEQLKRQIKILKEVLILRENGENDSPYVCDNVGVIADAHELGSGAGYTIRRDIKQYINYEWSVREWLYERDGLEYEHGDFEVENERIKMINTLIERYEATLKKAEAV